MSNDITKAIKFLIVGDATSARKAFGDTGKAASQAAVDIEKPGKASAIVGAAIGGALLVGAAAATKFGADSVKAFQTVAGESMKLSRITGMTVEESSRLRFAFKMTGVDGDVAAKSLGKFEKTLVTASQSGRATASMTQALGFAFLDAKGKVLPMADLLPKVADRFKTMPNGAEKTALAMQLFGKTGADLIPFLNKGSAGLDELAAKSDKLGLTLNGSTVGAVTQAKAAQREWDASLEGLSVQIGANVLPILNHLTVGMTGVLKTVRENAAVLGPTTTLVGGLAGALGLLAVATKVKGGLDNLTGSVKALQTRLSELGASTAAAGSTRLGAALTGLGAAIPFVGVAAVAAGAAFVYYSAKAEEARQEVQSLTEAIRADSGALGENTRAATANALQKLGAFDTARELGISESMLTDAILKGGEARTKVDRIIAESRAQRAEEAKQTAQMTGDQRDYTAAASDSGTAAERLAGILGDQSGKVAQAREAYSHFSKAMQESDEAADKAGPTVEELATKTKEIADAANEAAQQIDKETAAIWGNMDAALAASGNAIAWEAALDKAAETIGKTGSTWDKATGRLQINTEAGRKNKAALDDMIKTGEAVIRGMIDSGEPIGKVTAELNRQHDAFVETAKGATGSKARAEELWKTYALNPGVVETLIKDRGLKETQDAVVAYTKRVNEVPPAKQTEFLAAVASGDLAKAKALLDDAAKHRTATISVRLQMPSTGTAVGTMRLNADGAVYTRYGDGGTRTENHVAQIARGGDWRIWAEPETEGEAYIPLARSKRRRSLDIWRETGRLLGAASFADGGTTGSPIPAAFGSPSTEAIASAVGSAINDGLRGVVFELDGRPFDVRLRRTIGDSVRGARR